ncbi:MAG TPA: DNA repair protein RecO, partial [Enterococcus faecalis]|nr:DNA repair protein RecO [Enterococcus faecalis]
FDYSSKYSGVLCEKHWHLDEQRYHADPRAIHFIRLFAQVSYEKVQNIQVKEETKKSIRETIDMLYDEYVGLHLKRKKFIDQRKTWENRLKMQQRKKEEK